MAFLSPELKQLDLEFFMDAALAEAELAGQAGELSIGAVVVIDGAIVSRGRARHQHSRSQLRHAELNAMLDGGEQLWQEYRRAVLFTTLEPCPLCLGAAVMADIPHIVFGLHDRVVLSGLTLVSSPYIQRHIKSYYGGVLEEKSIDILGRYNPKELDYIMTGAIKPYSLAMEYGPA